MRQIETSRTLVFDAPRRARSFFEALVTDNLDIGRPELIELIFKRGQRRGTPGAWGIQDEDRHLRHRGQRQRLLPALPHQTVFEGRAGAADRDVINDPGDLGCLRRFAASRRTAGPAVCQHPRCSILNASVRAASWRVQPLRIARPHPHRGWQEGLGLTVWRPSGPSPGRRVMHQRALRHRHHQREPARLDDRIARRCELQHEQASYDLARLRVNALITRILPGKNRYRLTGDGLRFAIFYTKLHDRLLGPLLAADQPPAPVPLRKALHTIDIHITETIDQPDSYRT